MLPIAKQTRDNLIIPLLKKFDEYEAGFYKENMVNLLLGTEAQESKFIALRQSGYSIESNEGAFGKLQIELKTLFDTNLWLQRKKPFLAHKISLVKSHILSDKENLMWNDAYSILIARSVYLSIMRPLPDKDDIWGMANYWNDHYNRNPDKGTPEEFVAAYEKYCI